MGWSDHDQYLRLHRLSGAVFQCWDSLFSSHYLVRWYAFSFSATEPILISNPVATFIVWSVIGVCHIRFRRAQVAQGEDPSQLPYQAAFYPYGTYIALAANIFLVFFQGYTCFLNPFSASDFVINYILLPVFVLFFVVYKVWNKTKWVRLEDMDIWTGRREFVNDEEELDKDQGWWGKLYGIVVG